MLVASQEASEFYGWSTHGGFSKAACYFAVDGPGHVRIVTDLVGAPPRPLLHFCAGEAQVCPASQPGRAVCHSDDWHPWSPDKEEIDKKRRTSAGVVETMGTPRCAGFHDEQTYGRDGHANGLLEVTIKKTLSQSFFSLVSQLVRFRFRF